MKKLLCNTCKERIIREIDTKGSLKRTHHMLKVVDRLKYDLKELDYYLEQEI